MHFCQEMQFFVIVTIILTFFEIESVLQFFLCVSVKKPIITYCFHDHPTGCFVLPMIYTCSSSQLALEICLAVETKSKLIAEP